METKKDENFEAEADEDGEGSERDSHEEEAGWVYTCIIILMLVVYSALLIPYAIVYNWVWEPVKKWMRNKKKNKK